MSKSIESAAIDDLSQQLMIRENVNGLALAFINDGKPEYVTAYVCCIANYETKSAKNWVTLFPV